MLADAIRAAIDAAPSFPANHLEELTRHIWRAYGAGHLDDAQADALGRAVEARKPRPSLPGPGGQPAAPRSPYGARKTPRSPDRQASIERRRRLASSGMLPPALAAEFTAAELAVMAVLAREAERPGGCRLHQDAVAALAGCCRRTVQYAVAKARRLGLLDVTERRRAGQKSLTNITRVRSPEWRVWLARRFKARSYPQPPSSISNLATRGRQILAPPPGLILSAAGSAR